MKKILFLILVLLYISCDTPYKIVTTYTIDSLGRTVKTVNKYYDNTPPISTNTVIWNDPFYSPYYRQYYRPYVVIPQRPIIRKRH